MLAYEHLQSTMILSVASFQSTPLFFFLSTRNIITNYRFKFSDSLLSNKVIFTGTGFISQSANFDFGFFFLIGYLYYSSESSVRNLHVVLQ